MTDAGIVFYQLEKRAQYALNSHSRDLVYETYGAAKMARQHMFDIPKLMQVLSEILSDKYGCTIIMTAIPKDQAECKGDLA